MTWSVVPLGEVADTALGKMLDRGNSRGLPAVPYLRNVNVQWGRVDTEDLLTMELADEDRERFAVRSGDLLVCEGGEIGRCAIWQGRDEYLAYQKALHRIRPHDALDVRYLRYLFEHHARSGVLARHSTGSTIAHLPQQQLRRLPVPLPALGEQHRLVDLLEDHLSILDAAQRTLRFQHERTLKLEGLDAHHTTVRADGRWVSVADVAEFVTDGDHNPPKRVTSGVPHVTAKGVRPDGSINFDLGTFVTEEGFAQTAKRYLPIGGDVIVTCVGTIGRVAVVPPDVRFSADRNLAAIRVDASIAVAEYVALALRATSAQAAMSKASSSTAQPHLYLKDLRGLQIRLPDLAEQQRRVQASRLRTARYRSLARGLTSAQIRATSLRRSLLAAAFSGRLTDRGLDPVAQSTVST